MRARVTAVFVVLALLGAACTKKATPQTSASQSPSSSAAAVPTATTTTLPVTYGYYDGHVDTMISTDISDQAIASASHINYSPNMMTQALSKFPSLYLITGTTAPGQIQVFGSEPGEDDYSPLWREINVSWKPGVKPVLLVKDDQIKDLASKNQLTMTPKSIILNCPIVKVSSSSTVPTATTITLPVTYGYYDGHVDTMISTDISDKAMASASHINYSGNLMTQAASKFPSLYLITGTTAPGQIQVFGSQPGEDDYSPLWQEINVSWKPGVTPVLLVKDDQIKDLASKGQLTMTAKTIILNCPIVHVGS